MQSVLPDAGQCFGRGRCIVICRGIRIERQTTAGLPHCRKRGDCGGSGAAGKGGGQRHGAVKLTRRNVLEQGAYTLYGGVVILRIRVRLQLEIRRGEKPSRLKTAVWLEAAP